MTARGSCVNASETKTADGVNCLERAGQDSILRLQMSAFKKMGEAAGK